MCCSPTPDPICLSRALEWVPWFACARQVGFFDELGAKLREAIHERQQNPEAFADECSVMQIYLQAR